MTPETITGLSKLRALFPANFDIVGKCLDHDVSSVRIFHLQPETSGGSDREKLYAFIREVVQKCIRGLIEQKTGTVLGYYHKKSDTIALNADLDWDRIANELNRQLGIDVKPSEIYVWIFFHEIGHKRGLDESEADTFAKVRFKIWKETNGKT